MQIRRAKLNDVDKLLPQFNAYRDFYKMESKSEEARAFLAENLSKERSVIFIAIADNGDVVGFTQLYPRLSSLKMRDYIYLSDLYVDKAYRRDGVGRLLMKKAEEFCTENGYPSIELQTANTNVNAQELYESEGYELEKEFRTYCLKLSIKPLCHSEGATATEESSIQNRHPGYSR